MRIFNLAEELEKERKKNKELEEKRIKDNYFIGGLSREIKELQENIKIALEMCKERQDRIDKAIEYIENTIETNKNLPDYSKYYLENYDIAIGATHSSYSGVMLETIKSATNKTCEDLLDLLKGE